MLKILVGKVNKLLNCASSMALAKEPGINSGGGPNALAVLVMAGMR